jgi:hypothetical protein
MAWRRTEGVIVELPTNMKVGSKWYRFWYSAQPPRTTCYGRIHYAIRTVHIYDHKGNGTPIKPADVRETFWHELTHAILYEMKHDLHNNEKFVTQFSHMLSKAVDSARFSDERI